MRILLTADPEVPVPPAGYGGIERIVDALVCRYDELGHQVELIAHPGSQSPAGKLWAWRGSSSLSKWDTLCNSGTLTRAAKSFRPDIVHSFSRLAYLLPLLPFHIAKVMSYQRPTGGQRIRIASTLAGTSLGFTGCSEHICGMGRRYGGHWTAVPNFTDVSKFSFVASVPHDAPLLFLSRIESIKGPDMAIAIARAAGRPLILAGNRAEFGPERTFWDREVAPHLGQNGIEWVGEVDDRRKNELLGKAAGLIVPIRWDEPFGIVFVESLACGTPVITCRRGALPEIITPNKTGFFISSIEEGVNAVRQLGTLNRAECRRIAEEQFSVTVCASSYLNLYAELLKGMGKIN